MSLLMICLVYCINHTLYGSGALRRGRDNWGATSRVGNHLLATSVINRDETIVTINYIIITLLKGIPIKDIKTHGECGCKGPNFAATALGRGRVASPMLGSLYSRESPGTRFTGSWVDSRTSLDIEERRKISTPLTPGIEPGLSSP